jgi:hypothetical protein
VSGGNVPVASPLPLANARARLNSTLTGPRRCPGRRPRPGPDGETRVIPTSGPRLQRGSEPRALAQAAVAPRLLSARETAVYLGLAYDTVLDLVKAGALQPVRLALPSRDLRKLLFDRLALDRLIDVG